MPSSTEGYRSSRLHSPAAGTDVLAPEEYAGRAARLRSLALDVLTLPVVAARPSPRVCVLGAEIPVERELRRWSWRTERGMEIAMGKRALAGRDPAGVLELGNVLPLAGAAGHTVVDKYEQGPGVINEDILDWKAPRKYDLVVSISTVEHIGFDEIPPDHEKGPRALEVLRDHLAPGGDLLVTIPVGYNRLLETAFVAGEVFDQVVLLVKASRRARWEERPLTERAEIAYGEPFACGNGVLVGVRGTPLRGA